MLDPGARRRQKVRNAVQSVVLLGGLVLVAALLAWMLFGLSGLVAILVAGGVLALLRPRMPARAVLAMYGAQQLPYDAAPGLHRTVAVLAQRAGLPAAPTLYYVASSVPNAFAVGRGDDASLAVTDGLLRRLTSREVAGVLAHEIGHVRAGDTTVMSLSDAVGRLVQGLSYLGLFSVLVTLPLTLGGDLRPLVVSGVLILLPTAVNLAQLALSRSREFDADLEGAALTGDPEGLASALEELERATGQIWERTMVPRGRVPDPLVLRTHPATGERARRLRELVPRDPSRHLGDHRHAPPAGRPPVGDAPRLRAPGIRW
ncbi:zinc metalloprotease HtpX [Blastococcus sp. SYSU D00669]